MHPLAVMNIADHFTRRKYRSSPNEDDKNFRVVGFLLGQRQGKQMEIMNTIEARFRGEMSQKEGDDLLDMEFAQKRLAAYKVMFPELDCIGFYSAISSEV